MKSQWIEPPETTVPVDLLKAVGGHPLVAKILIQRGLTRIDHALAFINPNRYLPAPATDLPGVSKALSILEGTIRANKTICVWGDFDVDGQTATTLLVSALKNLGARVVFHIPVRAQESHGVNLHVLNRFIEQGIDLLLTCDTGIAAHAAVDYATHHDVQVIITDHHDLPPDLPKAASIVNPKLLPPGHPLSSLPGVGVAFKLVEALYGRYGKNEMLAGFLDLVALGIVADLAIQTGDTRYLLQRGLETLRGTKRLGLQALMSLADLNPRQVSEEQIAYTIGPRLNAIGRLGDANSCVEFLTTEEPGRARTLASQLESYNAQRKLLTDQVFQGAIAQIEQNPRLLDQAGLVLSHPAWPAGVIGIVASRLVDRYHKPTILIAAPQGELGRGSARSIDGINISAAIAAHGNILSGFGGHPMAAGLSIYPDRIPEFREAFSQTVQRMQGAVDTAPTLRIDSYVALSELTVDLVEDLERLAPFGPGNPPLNFACKRMRIADQKVIGRNREHVEITVIDEKRIPFRVIWWQGAGWELPEGQFDLAYVARSRDYKGQPQVQIEWVEARPIDEPVTGIQPLKKPVKVLDYRHVENPREVLDNLLEKGEHLVWCEGEAQALIGGLSRYDLHTGENLVIWTSPPGHPEFQDVLQRVAPQTVYLFGVDPGIADLEAFMKQLMGLVKHTLRVKGGKTSVPALAARLAQREAAVRLGLNWLEARGVIRILDSERGELVLARGEGDSLGELEPLTQQLRQLLGETAAFRAHFQHTDRRNLEIG